MQRLNRLVSIAVIVLGAAFASAQSKSATPEVRASHYLKSIQHEPELLLPFLREMPKGGDLHNHLGGAVYAEDLIDYAAQDKLCVDRPTMMAVRGQCDAACDSQAQKPAAECGYIDPNL